MGPQQISGSLSLLHVAWQTQLQVLARVVGSKALHMGYKHNYSGCSESNDI